MLLVTVLLGAAVFALGTAAWVNWRQRLIAERRARVNADLATLGSGLSDLAHDLSNLFTVMVSNLSSAHDLSRSELREVLAEVEQAARAADRMVRTIRAGDKRSDGSLEGVVRLHAALLRRRGVPIDVEVEDDILYRGSDADAMRVVQNLLVNAVRAAAEVPRSRVRVELCGGVLRVVNRMRDPSVLDGRIYERGVSHHGSSGLGLAIACESAARLGWTVRHEVHGDEVTFTVGPSHTATR